MPADGEGLDAGERLGIAQRRALAVDIAEAAAGALADNAGPLVADIAQVRDARGCHGVECGQRRGLTSRHSGGNAHFARA